MQPERSPRRESSSRNDGAGASLPPISPSVKWMQPSYIGSSPPLGEGIGLDTLIENAPDSRSYTYHTVEAAGVYETGGITDCVGMIVYDPEGQRALIFHGFSGSHQEDLRSSLETFGECKASYRVYLCGHSYSDDIAAFTKDAIDMMRSETFSIVRQYVGDVHPIYSRWCGSDRFQSLIIRIPDGEVNLFEHSRG